MWNNKIKIFFSLCLVFLFFITSNVSAVGVGCATGKTGWVSSAPTDPYCSDSSAPHGMTTGGASHMMYSWGCGTGGGVSCTMAGSTFTDVTANAACCAMINQSPTIGSASATQTTLVGSGQASTLSVSASDPEGDLLYDWSCAYGATTDNSVLPTTRTGLASSNIIFTSPSVGTSTVYTCTVIIREYYYELISSATRTVNVTVNPSTNGACGTANGHGYYTTTDINTDAMKCSAGTFTSFTDNGNNWSWTCAGAGGGTTASCSANKVACGTSHNTIRKDQPSTNLCQYGTNTTLTLTGNSWLWTCNNNPGTNAACYAYKTTCGSANGLAFSSAPTTNLCATNGGTASAVSGTGPWTWTCTGNDSQVVSCSAIMSVCVSGGGLTCTETTDGLYIIDKYTGAGTTTWTAPTGVASAQVLVVAGGGGGGGSAGDGWNAGGGGAGGLTSNTNYSVTPGTPVTVTVGAGGARGTASSTNNGSTTTIGANGGNSVFGTITVIGGGGGGASSGSSGGQGTKNNGVAGGSGGGAATSYSSSYINGGTATSGQGNVGGSGSTGGTGYGGGGGGAGGVGTGPVTGGNGGGLGLANSITGSSVTYATGGGTGATTPADATAGTGNGGTSSVCPNGTAVNSGSGGSGVVIVRYSNYGICGSSNNQIVSSAPTTNLCNGGTASAISGIGPWTWTCTGSVGSPASCSANFAITQVFTNTGATSWTPPADVSSVEVLVVGGGGGGGMDMGGGGGGGGVIYNANYSVAPSTPVAVIVGVGGNGAPAAGTNGQPPAHQYTIPATNGGNSVFGTLTAIGGGFGGSSYRLYTPGIAGGSGGSGGGASGYNDSTTTYSGGTGTAGQGYRGGNSSATYYSGGGGGAGGAGADSTAQANGGPGILNTILGSNYYWGGGGGGAGYTINGGNGGIGGGGGGAVGTTTGGAGFNNGSPGGGGTTVAQTNKPGGDGGINTGGGGGGGSHYNANNKGGNGGSGVVIVRYATSTVACGLSNNQTFVIAPTINLCAGGVASAISGIGPWTWTCSLGGTTVSCSANFTSCVSSANTTCTQTYDGSYVVNKYTGAGSTVFALPSNITSAEVLIVGGGGGGGEGQAGFSYGGSGGGGGVLAGTLTSLSGSYTVTVGSGGAAATAGLSQGGSGGNSAFGSYTAYGGGYGASGATNSIGGSGGSGGGGVGGGGVGSLYGAGSATQTSQSPLTGYGNSGGGSAARWLTGGGGGAGGVGGANNNYAANGMSFNITGSSVTYALGGWTGGGAGAANLGNGGGSGDSWASAGGSGTVIVRYLSTAGICGTSNGGVFSSAPSSGLCLVGTASAVSGSNRPWTWTCTGTDSSVANCSTSAIVPMPGLGLTSDQPGTDCNQIYVYNLDAHTSGLYWIKPTGASAAFQAYCDMTNDSGGWTLALQNNSTVTTPSPTWTNAINTNTVSGTLGSTLTNFDLLLGLSYWNNLGTQLRAEVGSTPSALSHKATYTFSLTSATNYTLNLSNQNVSLGGTTPGLYSYHSGKPFTTYDSDHDAYSANCAASFGNHPWWYGACWDGNFFAGGSGYQEAPYWTGSTSDYYAYGSMWIRNPNPTTPIVLAQVTPVPTPSSSSTPSYTFNSTAAGTIIYGGDCSSSTSSAIAGDNTITFNSLSAGVHSNCTIAMAGSNVLAVNSFTVTASTINGACNAMTNGSTVSSAPVSPNLCTAGTESSVTTNATTYTWNCTGTGTGHTDAGCYANIQGSKVNGKCGSANYVPVSSAPTQNLCTAGTESSVTTNASTYTWTCSGVSGGANDACMADIQGQTVAGSCNNTSNGHNFTTAPSTNLCSASAAVPTVSGNGPWTWTCTGLNAGNANCTANKALPQWQEVAPF